VTRHAAPEDGRRQIVIRYHANDGHQPDPGAGPAGPWLWSFGRGGEWTKEPHPLPNRYGDVEELAREAGFFPVTSFGGECARLSVRLFQNEREGSFLAVIMVAEAAHVVRVSDVPALLSFLALALPLVRAGAACDEAEELRDQRERPRTRPGPFGRGRGRPGAGEGHPGRGGRRVG
jgi:hypothetical protein